MTRSPVATGFSAAVELKLIAAGQTLELAQIGPGMVCLRAAKDLPRGAAIVVMTVDGRERQWAVDLPDGASSDSVWVRTSNRATEQPCITADGAARG